MTDEHPPRLPLDDHETGILSFEIDGPEIREVEYVAAAEGPDGYLAGYSEVLSEEDKVEGPPDGINGWTTIGFGYIPVEPLDDGDVEEVWGDGAPLRTQIETAGVVEVRYSQVEEKWWTVPAYIETDPSDED